MITRQGGGSGFGSSSGSGPSDAELCELSYEISGDILDSTHVMFRLIKEGITKLMEERLGGTFMQSWPSIILGLVFALFESFVRVRILISLGRRTVLLEYGGLQIW